MTLRNCDVGTAEEQSARMTKYCDETTCAACKFRPDRFRTCILKWAQMSVDGNQVRKRKNFEVYKDPEEARQAWLDDTDNWDDFGNPDLDLYQWIYADYKGEPKWRTNNGGRADGR